MSRQKKPMGGCQHPIDAEAVDITNMFALICDDAEILPLQCSLCGVEAHGVAQMENENGEKSVARICPACFEDPEFRASGKSLAIPASAYDRGKLFLELVAVFAAKARSAGALPAVIRSPKVGGIERPAAILLYEEGGKVFRVGVPFPWDVDDPYAVCGQLARDALELHKALVSGKAFYSFAGNMLVLESASPDLLRAWSRP